MAEIVRAGLIQQRWTGDKESMIAAAVNHIQTAASAGAQVVCLQELFYGPYFCQVQDADYYSYTEAIPDGPTTKLLQDVARQHGIVIVAPMYEEEHPGIYYNTAAVIDADGSYLGKYRKTHIPQVKGFWEKFYFRPGNTGYPIFDTAAGRIGVYICYDRHFPEGWRALGLAGARIVFNPSATSRGLSQYLWRLEQPAAAVANEYFVGAINRVGVEPLGDNDFYGQTYFADPRGQLIGDAASDDKDEVLVRDLDMDQLAEVRDLWQFYRDRRPDQYGPLVSSRSEHAHADQRRHGGDGVRHAGRRRAGRRGEDRRGTGRGTSTRRGRRGRGGGSRGPGHRRHRQVRAARRDRRAHAHGDAVRRHVLRGHLRDRHPRRGVGRHHHDHRLRRPGQGHLAAGHAGQVARQGGRQLLDRLRLPHDRLRRQRHDAEGDGRLHRGRGEQLQDVHGLPRRVLRDRRRDPARHAAGGPLRRDRDDARGERHRHRPAGGAGAGVRPHGPGRARPDPAAGAGGRGHLAGHHAGQGGQLPGVHRAPVRPARARGGRAGPGHRAERVRRDLPAVPVAVHRRPGPAGLRGGQVRRLAAAAAQGPPGLAVEGPAHQRPVGGVHGPLPVLLQGPEGTRPGRLLQDPQRDARRRAPDGPAARRGGRGPAEPDPLGGGRVHHAGQDVRPVPAQGRDRRGLRRGHRRSTTRRRGRRCPRRPTT